MYYCEHHDQFTLYLNLPQRRVLASNWREHGVHTRGSANIRDYPILDYCAIQLQVGHLMYLEREPTNISSSRSSLTSCAAMAGTPKRSLKENLKSG